jgi:hypothetical protein
MDPNLIDRPINVNLNRQVMQSLETIADHMWWLALSVQIAVIMMVINVFIAFVNSAPNA